MGFTVWRTPLTSHKLMPKRDRVNKHRNYLARITLDSSRENDRREASLHEELAVMRNQFSQALDKHRQTPYYQYMTPHQAAWNGILEKILRTHPSATVMDAGCGWNFLGRFGNLVEKFPQATFWAVDISEQVINDLRKQCQDKPTVYPITSALNNLQDIPTHSVDIVIFTDVFEHLNNPTKVLYELKRVLKEDGILLLSQPNGALYGIVIAFHHLCGRLLPRRLVQRYPPSNSELERHNQLSAEIGAKYGRKEHFREHSMTELCALFDAIGMTVTCFHRNASAMPVPYVLVNAFNKFRLVRKGIALLDAILAMPTAKWELLAKIHIAESVPKEHIVKKR